MYKPVAVSAIVWPCATYSVSVLMLRVSSLSPKPLRRAGTVLLSRRCGNWQTVCTCC